MTNHMSGMMAYDGSLLLIGFVASLGCAAIMFTDVLRRVVVPRRVGVDAVMDAGHTLTAVGMAYMFAPASIQPLRTTLPAGFFLALALLYLGMSMTRPCLRHPRRSSCTLIVAESLAMAYMFALASWESTDITNGLRVWFGAIVVITAGRLALSGCLALPAGVSVAALGTRLVMGSGMLTMLALTRPM